MHVPLHVLLIRAFDELEALLSLFFRTKILSHRFSLTLLCGEILHEGTQLRVALHKSYAVRWIDSRSQLQNEVWTCLTGRQWDGKFRYEICAQKS